MKISRRSFIKLVPIGVAVGVASLWFLKQEPRTKPSGTVENSRSTQGTTSTGETFDFPVTWNGDQPINVDPKDYMLRVDGDVSNPLQLTLEQLYAMPQVSESEVIGCVEGWAFRVAWEGIPLSRLLNLAGAPSDFDHVTVESITGYATKINRTAIDSSTLIALKAGSGPLRVNHGYPARLVIPTKPGAFWVKYVARITCTKQYTPFDLTPLKESSQTAI